MEDLNLHILFFSVLLACAQSYIHMSQPISEEEVNCDEAEDFSKYVWSKFENHVIQPEVTKDIEPIFHLYRRGSILDHLVVLIHGFGSKKAVWAASMKEAIFENDPRENLAVLTVDWKKGARASFWDPIGSYNKAVANTRYIGLATQRLVQCLQKREKSADIKVHCVGHSLGAHACSFLANALESSTGSKMFRVTGLDPAGPQFTTKLEPGTLTIYKPLKSAPRDQRLDETDAEVVDIIHTDGNQWGTMRPIGDIDFYFGKSLQTLGTHQAGCHTGDLCDHSKSIKLFSESLSKRGSTKFNKVLECQFEWKELKVESCREPQEKPRFGYFYEHQPEMGKGVGIFGVLDQELEEDVKLKQEWGGWEEDWEDGDSWEDEKSWEDKDSWEDKKSWEDKDSWEDEKSWEDEEEAFQVETDSSDNSRKTTSASKVAEKSDKAKDETGSTPTDDYLSENRLHLNTETDYHIHIGSLLLTKTDMIIISIGGAVLSFALSFLVGCYLVRFCRKSAKQANFVPDSSEEVLLPV